MLPPSDSLRHQAHKLAEARANRTGLPSAPPPYSQVPHVTMGGHSLLDMDEDDSPSPITITLDASIHVQGNGNTIVLPSTSAKAAEQHQQHNRISSSDSTAPSTSAQTTALQSAQKHRQNKLSEMASTIIAALREADALLDVESGRCRPIAVHLNAGVKIDGSRNVICVGAAAGPSRMGRKNLLSGDGEGVSRKRRAQSEPPGFRAPKRDQSGELKG